MDSVIPVFSLKELLAQDNEQLDKLREVLINRLNFYCRFLLRHHLYFGGQVLVHSAKCGRTSRRINQPIDENSAYSLDTGIFHLSEYEDARSTTTKSFQSTCRKFFDAELSEKNKIVSCGIPPSKGIFGFIASQLQW